MLGLQNKLEVEHAGGLCAQNGWAPLEGQAQRGTRGAVDAKVEQEAAHGGDDQECAHCVALQPQRRHAACQHMNF